MNILEALKTVTEEIRDWVTAKFISKENIDTSLNDTSENPVQNKAIKSEVDKINRLVGTTSVSAQIENAVDGLATYQHINSTCAPAIKNTVSGESLTITDASPFAHKCSCKLISDTYEEIIGGSNNIYDFKTNGGMRTMHKFSGSSSVSYTVDDDGTIILNGTAGIYDVLNITLQDLISGQEYTFSCGYGDDKTLMPYLEITPFNSNGVPLTDNIVSIYDGKYTFTASPEISKYTVNVLLALSEEGITFTNAIFYPLLEYGSVATSWGEYSESQTEIKPYIEDFSTVKVDVNGKTYMPKADGTVTDIDSISPIMEITTDNDKVNITEFTYCVDTKSYVNSRAKWEEYTFTETDPTVPAWAKAASKPSYTKSEVGLGNVDNVKQYSASNPPPYPVTSVNGSVGAVIVNTLPVVSTNDNGKVLMVVNGVWQAVDLNMTIDANGVVSV